MTTAPDLGRPIAYLVLAEGTPVYDSGGAQVGSVAAVLADEPVDVFHGLIASRDGDSRPVFAGRDQIRQLYERGVILSVPADQLHDIDEDPAAAEAAEQLNNPLQVGLRRARQWLRLHPPK